MNAVLASSKREEITAVIALLMLVQGAYFDSHSLAGLRFSRSLVNRAFRAMIDSGVIIRYTLKRKYLFTEEFLERMKQEITKGMPRRTFVHYPDFAVFDISGIEIWSEEELELYVGKLRKHWLARTRPKD